MNQVAPVSTVARIRGWLLAVLGVSLSVGMAVFAIYFASVINHNDPSGGAHWNGSHDMTVRVFELLATIFTFGVVAIAGGIFQLRRGRASWIASLILLGLVCLMYLLGQDITKFGR